MRNSMRISRALLCLVVLITLVLSELFSPLVSTVLGLRIVAPATEVANTTDINFSFFKQKQDFRASPTSCLFAERRAKD